MEGVDAESAAIEDGLLGFRFRFLRLLSLFSFKGSSFEFVELIIPLENEDLMKEKKRDQGALLLEKEKGHGWCVTGSVREPVGRGTTRRIHIRNCQHEHKRNLELLKGRKSILDFSPTKRSNADGAVPKPHSLNIYLPFSIDFFDKGERKHY
ncbi:hypothetical protein Salat_0207800 [Sesamum alatum]|uniref:Uncharacterized protein n=1 Tax=Sesamum alatum TaxID=300844 RepID=A0AAE1YYR2_9LAMI|nr:hypothetical protein Salat_0207800 [Sesamum alatum]